MKIIFMCGSHPRHLYIAKKLKENNLLKALVIEQREPFVITPPSNIDEELKEIFIRHFSDREKSEYAHFGSITPDEFDIPKKFVNIDTLNDRSTLDFIKENNPDGIISYGIHVLKPEFLDELPSLKWNIHGGLSPWYKGNITMFWPFYMLKPNFVGVTIHQLTSRLDGGGIIHQSVPKLSYGDKLHDVACKAVAAASDDIITILKMLENGKTITPVKQAKNGKLWVSTDWTPEHLRPVYKLYENKIVDMFLDGKLEVTKPDLIRLF